MCCSVLSDTLVICSLSSLHVSTYAKLISSASSQLSQQITDCHYSIFHSPRPVMPARWCQVQCSALSALAVLLVVCSLSSLYVNTYTKQIFSASSQQITGYKHHHHSIFYSHRPQRWWWCWVSSSSELHGGGGTPHTPAIVQPPNASSYREVQLQ